ncbi:hypothetical protein CsatA_022354 [Cannabis sativa]
MASSIMKVLWLVVLALVIASPVAHAITCSQVSSNLAPCLDYLRNGGTVPDACCNNIKSLSNAARTPADHQVVCNCLSKVARGSKGFMGYNASGLPGKCGVTSCNRIR